MKTKASKLILILCHIFIIYIFSSVVFAEGYGVKVVDKTSASKDAKQSPDIKKAKGSVFTQQEEKIAQQADAIIARDPLSEEAFAGVARSMVPMSPDQIKTLRYLLDTNARAVAAPPRKPPRPTLTERIVNLSPGATPPVIRLKSGYVTSVVFLDATGAAWPVEWLDVGDPKNFNIQWDKKGNTILIQPSAVYRSANLAIKLQKANTPVMVTLMSGQAAVDYRVDLRVPGLGPNASTSSMMLPAVGDDNLLTVLNGVPPKGSLNLLVDGGNAQAWQLGKRMFFRTRMTVLSPSWITKMSSADGTNAYVLPNSPIVLALFHGKMVTLSIHEKEGLS